MSWSFDDIHKASTVAHKIHKEKGGLLSSASLFMVSNEHLVFSLREMSACYRERFHLILKVIGNENGRFLRAQGMHKESNYSSDLPCTDCLKVAPDLRLPDNRRRKPADVYRENIPLEVREVVFLRPDTTVVRLSPYFYRPGIEDDSEWIDGIMRDHEYSQIVLDFRGEEWDPFDYSGRFKGRYRGYPARQEAVFSIEELSEIRQLLDARQSLVVIGRDRIQSLQLAGKIAPLILTAGLSIEPYDHIGPGDLCRDNETGKQVVVGFRTEDPYTVSGDFLDGHGSWIDVKRLSLEKEGHYLCEMCGRGESRTKYREPAKQKLCSGCWFRVELNYDRQ